MSDRLSKRPYDPNQLAHNAGILATWLVMLASSNETPQQRNDPEGSGFSDSGREGLEGRLGGRSPVSVWHDRNQFWTLNGARLTSAYSKAVTEEGG
jgi:hypothetical protein